MPGIATALAAAGGSPQGEAAGAAASGLFGWLLAFCREPGVLESLLALLLLGGVLWFWWRMSRLVRGAKSRQAVEDYLFGVEQALHGDLAGARARLERVVAADPENHFARLLLGKVLAELGEPEQAHKQHLYLQRAFGVDSPENDLLLAHSLFGAGLAQEAAAAAELALQRLPGRADGFAFLYRARLQAGDFDGAAAAGRRMLELVPDGPARQRWQRDVAHTLARDGAERLARGDAAGAQRALQAARRLDPQAEALPLLQARVQAAERGLPATVQALLAAPAAGPGEPGEGGDRALVVAPGQPLEAAAARRGLPMATFAGLVPASRWQCRRCAAPLAGPHGECPRCGSRDEPVQTEPALVQALGSPMHTMDAIDANTAHVQRLVRQALDDPGEAGASARLAVLELRERAVAELLRQAWHRDGAGRDAAVELLRAMGPEIAPVLFAASDALEQQRVLPLGARSPAAVVGRVVQGFDRAALPHVEVLFASAKPEHRKILIDYFLGLADLEAFQIVLERFPPLEILHRLDKADGAVLRRFLQAVPQGHFVATTLLREPAFYREEDVLAAIPGARHPEALEQALLARGPSRALTVALIGALGDPALGEVAARLLAAFGEPVLDHVLAAFSDPERDDAERRRLGDLLVRGAGPTARRLAAAFGPEPSAIDGELRRLLVRIGEPAVDPLRTAYAQVSLLERLAFGLLSRHTNRRAQIVQALQAIGTGSAAAALGELLAEERDQNLRLRLQQALHGLPGPGGGDG
ncbi:MAG: hypothetical protein FJ265_17230 [Planctomycetes bacterium]|nr:hypothetical protein [Planctomycetota bacterium]